MEVLLKDGTRAELGPAAVRLLQQLREGLADGGVAHLEVDRDLIPAERAAELLGVSRPTVYTWQDQGRLGRVDVGSKRLVPLSDVAALANAKVRRKVLAEARAVRRQRTDARLTHKDLQALGL